jgi:hypothetical protein
MTNESDNGDPTDFRTGVGQTAYKRRLAYEHLGIDPRDVEPVPFFRHNLRRIARSINQGCAKDEMIHPFDYYCLPQNLRPARWRKPISRFRNRIAGCYRLRPFVTPLVCLNFLTGS